MDGRTDGPKDLWTDGRTDGRMGWDGMGWDGMGWDGWMDGWMNKMYFA
jgi:hypothetical protein